MFSDASAVRPKSVYRRALLYFGGHEQNIRIYARCFVLFFSIIFLSTRVFIFQVTDIKMNA